MLTNVKNPAAVPIPSSNHLLAIVHRRMTPQAPETARRCRFDMFIRIAPGYPGIPSKNGLQRTWCYRGDKFATEEFQMLRKLLNHLQKKIQTYDRVELYDNHKANPERILLKITDGVIERNQLNQYNLMLLNYALPDYLKISV